MSRAKSKTIHEDSYRLLIDRLRASREKATVTQVALAERLGTDQSYVSKYERSERRLDLLEVRAICRALGVAFGDFIVQFDRELKSRDL